MMNLTQGDDALVALLHLVPLVQARFWGGGHDPHNDGGGDTRR